MFSKFWPPGFKYSPRCRNHDKMQSTRRHGIVGVCVFAFLFSKTSTKYEMTQTILATMVQTYLHVEREFHQLWDPPEVELGPMRDVNGRQISAKAKKAFSNNLHYWDRKKKLLYEEGSPPSTWEAVECSVKRWTWLSISVLPQARHMSWGKFHYAYITWFPHL